MVNDCLYLAMYLSGHGHHLPMPPGLFFTSFQLHIIEAQHYHVAMLHHQCNIVTHFFGVLRIRRTVMLFKIWYHGSDERLQGACAGGVKRRNHAAHQGRRRSRPPDAAVFVKNVHSVKGA